MKLLPEPRPIEYLAQSCDCPRRQTAVRQGGRPKGCLPPESPIIHPLRECIVLLPVPGREAHLSLYGEMVGDILQGIAVRVNGAEVNLMRA